MFTILKKLSNKKAFYKNELKNPTKYWKRDKKLYSNNNSQMKIPMNLLVWLQIVNLKDKTKKKKLAIYLKRLIRKILSPV